MTTIPNWADVLTLREEVVSSDGSVGELQMSLGKVVYQTADVPYRDVNYWSEITETTDSMLHVFSLVARRLWTTEPPGGSGLLQFDQGMGGGKSHTLVGMWHMATSPDDFFSTRVGKAVANSVASVGASLDLQPVHVVSLCADQFSPGKASPLFGPAQNLYERFLWALYPTDREEFDRLRARGADKATVKEALEGVGKPVLVLIDELMDYVAAGASNEYVDQLLSLEHQFLNSLFDASDDTSNVAILLVMIRSDLDAQGYAATANEFREFVQARVNRNGTAVRVTESKDFMTIIRRRLFDEAPTEKEGGAAAAGLKSLVTDTWRDQVFDRLPGGRTLASVCDRLIETYPFHPDVVWLVQDEWSSTVGFQRVRSTVRIFASTLLHWVKENQAGNWVPPLIGIGDLPLDGNGVLDNLLNSGLLLGNESAVQGFANVASTDIVSISGKTGRAVEIDEKARVEGIELGQPSPSVRMATALFMLSLVNRSQGARGATKSELLAATWTPEAEFSSADEVFARITDPDEGLGSLEIDRPGNNRDRFWLSIKRTLKAVHRGARNQIEDDAARAAVWDAVRAMAEKNQSSFDKVVLVDAAEGDDLPGLLGRIDSQATRLVVLDPVRWALADGQESGTKAAVEEILGLGKTPSQHGASCVVALVNVNQKRYMLEAAKDVLAWRHVLKQLSESDADTLKQARQGLSEAEASLAQRVLLGYRHFAYVAAGEGGKASAVVEVRRFEDDTRTSARGDHVWLELVKAGRAAQPGQLAPKTLELLMATFDRPLTPREVMQAFYSNPRFPLVASPNDVSVAWDGLLGFGSRSVGGWVLKDGEGQVRNFSGPGQVAVNRMDVSFQKADDSTGDEGEGSDGTDVDDGGEGKSGGDGSGIGESSKKLREYTLEIPHISLGDVETQKQVWRVLQFVTTRLDPAQRVAVDPQVMELKLTVTMAESDFDIVKEALRSLGKGKLTEQEPLA